MDLTILWLFWARGGDIAALICCSWAMWRGGFTEKVGAALIGSAWLLSFLLTGREGNGLGLYVLIIDIVTLIALSVLAIWSRKPWVFAAAACMINAVVSHFTPQLANLGIYSYVTAVGLWSGWLLLACLVWGVIAHLRNKT
jgi:hypothetical protein